MFLAELLRRVLLLVLLPLSVVVWVLVLVPALILRLAGTSIRLPLAVRTYLAVLMRATDAFLTRTIARGVIPPMLVCLGMLTYNLHQLAAIMRGIAAHLENRSSSDVAASANLRVDSEEFRLREMDAQWLGPLGLARPGLAKVPTWWQVVPTGDSLTVDVPDSGVPMSGLDLEIWQWLERPWDLEAPRESCVVMTLSVLRGAPPTTIFRWEVDQWEALDRPAADIDESDARVAPLAVLAATSDQWDSALELSQGSGLVWDGVGLDWVFVSSRIRTACG